MCIKTGHHGRPLLGLIRQTCKLGIIVIRLVPFWKLFDVSVGPMRDLGGQEREKRRAVGIVGLRLRAYEIKRSKGVRIIAIGGSWVVGMTLIGR